MCRNINKAWFYLLYLVWWSHSETIPWKQVFSPPPNQPYEPKPTTVARITYTSAYLWTLLPSSHTTPSWSLTPVTAPPRSVPLFSSCDPFKYDSDPCYLYQSILFFASPWFPSLLCFSLSCSVPLWYAWHRSMSPVLICAFPCCSFNIWALFLSATPKSAPIILSNLSSMPKPQMNMSKSVIPYNS